MSLILTLILWTQMICEQCKAEGKTSTITCDGGATTLMGAHNFYDETGRFHLHDPNSTTYSCKCSNGHESTQILRSSCWCGWPKEEPKDE